MPSTSSEPPTDTMIVRTGSDGRLRYTPAQRGELLEAFDRSARSAPQFAAQCGIKYPAHLRSSAFAIRDGITELRRELKRDPS